MQVIIHSISKQGVMSDDNFAWLQEHLGTVLPVCSIDWHSDGRLCILSVYRDDKPVVLFDTYGLEVEIVEQLPEGRFKL